MRVCAVCHVYVRVRVCVCVCVCPYIWCVCVCAVCHVCVCVSRVRVAYLDRAQPDGPVWLMQQVTHQIHGIVHASHLGERKR